MDCDTLARLYSRIEFPNGVPFSSSSFSFYLSTCPFATPR